MSHSVVSLFAAIALIFTATPTQGQDAARSILIPEETAIHVRTERAVDARHARIGEPVRFTLSENIEVSGAVAVPRGTALSGEVVSVRRAGALTGTSELTLKLTALELGGESYPVYSYQFRMEGVSRTAPALEKIGKGAAVGALAGNVLGSSATTGAGKAAKVAEAAAAGGAAGTAFALVTAPPPLVLPAEAQMDFYLAAPMSVKPVNAAEAERLSKRLISSHPVLYVHGER